jgi:hypothetical protein
MDFEGYVSVCENCQAPHQVDHKFCTTCSYPVGGEESEKRDFRLNLARQSTLVKQSTQKVKNARNIVYFMAGAFIVTGLVAGFALDDFPTLMVNGFMCLTFLIIAAWCDKNPFGALLTAFILYVAVQVAGAIIEPSSIASGLILKVIFIVGLVKGIQSAREGHIAMKELEKLKGVPVNG